MAKEEAREASAHGPGTVFMVIGSGGVTSVTHDWRQAVDRAKQVGGVIVSAPILADFRNRSESGS